VYKSVDGGVTWFPASKGYTGERINDIAIDPENPALVYAVGQAGTFKSYDGGENWIGLSNGPLRGKSWQQSIQIHPENPNIVYSGGKTSGTIYKSTNGGQDWVELYRFVDIPETGEPETVYQVRAIDFPVQS